MGPETTPLIYSFLRSDSRFYRTLPHIIYINISWKVVGKRLEMKYSNDQEREPLAPRYYRGDRPLYEGLYLIRDAYIDHEILNIHSGSNRFPSKCTFITIHSNRSDEEWLNVDLPIENFHIDEIEGLSVNIGEKCLDHFPDDGLDARYILRKRNSFYTIYPIGPYECIIARWEEIDRDAENWRTPQQVSLSHANTEPHLDGIIWQRADEN